MSLLVNPVYAVASDAVCDTANGLQLLNQSQVPLDNIKHILDSCDKTIPNDPAVLLLHGLLARKEALQNKHFERAIAWLEKAKAVAPPGDISFELELAITYEWANQPEKAAAIYQAILSKNKQNRPARLGAARVLSMQMRFNEAIAYYEQLLQENSKDIDALNGLGRVKLADKQWVAATDYFESALNLQPQNKDALLGLQQVKEMNTPVKPPLLCHADQGLALLNQSNPPLAQINDILMICDKNTPNAVQSLLLHGLLARRNALQTKHYQLAIAWLLKAEAAAAPKDFAPALELAVTYEWASEPQKSELIYQAILIQDPHNRNATLGQARVFRVQSRLSDAMSVYQQLLKENPNDIEALNGLGWVKLADKQPPAATDYFESVLKIQPQNKDALLGLQKIKDIKKTEIPEKIPLLCHADQGLMLLNQSNPPLLQIKEILMVCDKNTPNAVQALLLHGLLARNDALQTKHYQQAIAWLLKAAAVAEPKDFVPALELAVTYEWAGESKKAALIYQTILIKDPHNRDAILGQARVFRIQLRLSDAMAIYQQLLKENSKDIDALSGLGWVTLANKQWVAATDYFERVLKTQPKNKNALLGLQQVKDLLKQEKPPLLCDASQGLALLNQSTPPLAQIKQILMVCDKNTPNSAQALLLHGLLARHEALQNKHYEAAITWLLKAEAVAAPKDFAPELELAVTYEWANEPKKSALIYQVILTKDPHNRDAILGQARVFRVQLRLNDAMVIYQQLLKENPKDVEALNGLGWVKLADKQPILAKNYFENVLKIQPQNKDALLGLQKIKDIKKTELPKKPPSLCSADQGLVLLNQSKPPLNQIRDILRICDKNTPNATQALLLHGLLARYEASESKRYETAIAWLTKAEAAAAPNDLSPALELAVTYEWAEEPNKSILIYKAILAKYPHNRDAILGLARVYRMEFRMSESKALYQQLLKNNSADVDALNGLGLSQMANYEFRASKQSFEEALSFKPSNQESKDDLTNLHKATKYILALTAGSYTVKPEQSTGTDVYFFDNINATDGLTIFATHNSKQIGSEFLTTPTLLPNNSVLVGFQHIIPNKYGWSVNYDYREHNHLPLETRVIGNANLFLTPKLNLFGGLREGFPSPWQNQLMFSGLTLFTTLPMNLTFTSFFGNDQFGGKSSAYSIDLSKEFDEHKFYDIGTAYSPTLKNWEIHGRVIWPTFTNQAFVADFSHYYFNNSTFMNAGWRIYW